MESLITVIIPVYKVEKYLDKCVNSAVNQTYKNLEIFLVDDGSPDNCPKMCDEWAKKDNRIKVIHKENGGLSSARNVALDVANGDYIYFLDSDDFIKEDTFEIMINQIKKDNSDLCIANVEELDSQMNKTGKLWITKAGVFTKAEIFNDTVNKKSCYIIACGKLYSKNLFSNLRFAEGKLYEDEFLYYQIIDRCNLVSVITDSLYYYCQHEESIMGSTRNTLKRLGALEAFNNEFEYFYNNKYSRAIEQLINFEYIMIIDIMSNNKINISDKNFKDIIKYYNKACGIAIKSGVYSQMQRIITLLKILISAYPVKSLKNGLRRFKYLSLQFIRIWKLIIKLIPQKIKYGKKFAFLILTPTHGNLGDHAIAKAEYDLLDNYHIYEMPGSIFGEVLNYKNFPLSMKLLFGKNTLFLHGGGYLGTLWKNADNLVLNFIEHQKKNKIVVLPQTVYYSNDSEGEKWLERATKIYNCHTNLTILAREKISYEILNKIIKNVYLIPDVVLNLNECKENIARDGCLLCLRTDHEKTMDDFLNTQIKQFAEDNFEVIIDSDMNKSFDISLSEREKRLQEQFSNFRRAQIAVTDRLHGMVFAAITGTPCAVFASQSHKVKGIYDAFLSDLEYIKFVSSKEELEAFYDNIKGKKFVYDNSRLKPYYDKLKDIIK